MEIKCYEACISQTRRQGTNLKTEAPSQVFNLHTFSKYDTAVECKHVLHPDLLKQTNITNINS
jgi:hypothetical protein